MAWRWRSAACAGWPWNSSDRPPQWLAWAQGAVVEGLGERFQFGQVRVPGDVVALDERDPGQHPQRLPAQASRDLGAGQDALEPVAPVAEVAPGDPLVAQQGRELRGAGPLVGDRERPLERGHDVRPLEPHRRHTVGLPRAGPVGDHVAGALEVEVAVPATQLGPLAGPLGEARAVVADRHQHAITHAPGGGNGLQDRLRHEVVEQVDDEARVERAEAAHGLGGREIAAVQEDRQPRPEEALVGRAQVVAPKPRRRGPAPSRGRRRRRRR